VGASRLPTSDWLKLPAGHSQQMTDLELLQLERIALTATRDDAFDLAAGVLQLIPVIREQRQIILLMGRQAEDDVREGLIAAQRLEIEGLRRRLGQ
jgi:hypothetical protein